VKSAQARLGLALDAALNKRTFELIHDCPDDTALDDLVKHLVLFGSPQQQSRVAAVLVRTAGEIVCGQTPARRCRRLRTISGRQNRDILPASGRISGRKYERSRNERKNYDKTR